MQHASTFFLTFELTCCAASRENARVSDLVRLQLAPSSTWLPATSFGAPIGLGLGTPTDPFAFEILAGRSETRCRGPRSGQHPRFSKPVGLRKPHHRQALSAAEAGRRWRSAISALWAWSQKFLTLGQHLLCAPLCTRAGGTPTSLPARHALGAGLSSSEQGIRKTQ